MAHSTLPRITSLAVWATLLTAPLPALAISLQSVKVSEGPDNSQIVRVSMDEALKTMPMHFTTTNPHRIVLDFPGLDNPLGRKVETINNGAVRALNVAQSADRTRVVIDLNSPATYDLRKNNNELMVVLRGAAVQNGITPTHFASQDKNVTYGINDVNFRRGKNGEGRIEVKLSDAGTGVDIKQKGAGIQVDFLNTQLPQSLQRRLDVSEFSTPAQTVETFRQGKDTRMLVTPKGKWDFFAYQTGKTFILEVMPLDVATTQGLSKKTYEGEKLSLDFQDQEVRAVLKVIADFTGLNIVAADSVAGRVTIRLKDVPWDQALDIILRAKGLDKRVNGNVIWIEQSEALAKKEADEKRARRSSEELEELITRNYRLNYIRADDAMVILSGGSRNSGGTDTVPSCSPSSEGLKLSNNSSGANTAGGSSRSSSSQTGQVTDHANNRVLSARGAASFDLTSNTLVITDILDRHVKVEEVLKGIDLPAKQVMIEARIVLADDGFGRHLGSRLGVRTRGEFNGTAVGVNSTADTSATLANQGFPGVTSPYNVDLPTSVAAPSIGFTLINAAAETLISLELQALESDKRGKILSNPKVITTNLKPAVILQGKQIPYQTISQDGVKTTFKDALLCLLVSPQVLNNDDIILDVEVTKDAQGENIANAGPAINVKRVLTQVRVKNGETAILGGIFEQTQRNDTDKVPLLGDLPLLGYMFRNSAKIDEKSEMLIFLTPRLLQQ